MKKKTSPTTSTATQFTTTDVAKIAVLANIPVTAEETEKLAKGFTTTMAVVNQVFQVDVQGVEPTHQVTGLENVFREDEVDTTRIFTQEQALENAPKTHNGFFVVDRVLEE